MLCVCMNPSIDVTMDVPSLAVGGTNRATRVLEDAGGKGVNVALDMAKYGARDVSCTGVLREGGGEIISCALHEAGVSDAFIRRAGSVRRNIKLFDEKRREITEINARGEGITNADAREIKDMIARRGEFCVLTGSLPANCPASFYAEVIRESGAECALDADGEALALGAAAKPRVLKVNEAELRVISDSEPALALRALTEGGVGAVLASMGARGGMYRDKTGLYCAGPAKVRVNSTVGAGDSMLAGYLAKILAGATGAEAFAFACACAAASVETPGTRPPELSRINEIKAQIKIEKIAE